MTSNEDTSTRTIASVAAVLALLALGVSLAESTRSGTIAEFVATSKEVNEGNDKALLGQIEALNVRVKALESAPADDAPADDAPADDAPADDAPADDAPADDAPAADGE